MEKGEQRWVHDMCMRFKQQATHSTQLLLVLRNLLDMASQVLDGNLQQEKVIKIRRRGGKEREGKRG